MTIGFRLESGLNVHVYGKEAWEKRLFIKVEDEEPAPPYELLEALDQLKAKNISAKLILIPKGITIDRLAGVGKYPMGAPTVFNFFDSTIAAQLKDAKVDSSYWCLITDDLAIENVGENAEEALHEALDCDWRIPKLAEAVIAQAVTRSLTGSPPSSKHTYTYCAESVDSGQVVLGADRYRLDVYRHDMDLDGEPVSMRYSIGVIACRRFD